MQKRDTKRLGAYREDLEGWLRTYKAEAFPLPFCRDHQKAIAKLQTAIETGGKFCEAMPRGSGKTTIGEGAVQWALAYGWRRFVVIIGSTQEKAIEISNSILADFSQNEAMINDFPALCLPFKLLEGKPQRARFQLYDGQPINTVMRAGRFECASIPGSDCAGAIVVALGLTGSIRGPRKKMPDGSVSRPDFVWLDDPQTDESAASPSQTDTRERLISGAVLGMGGPGVDIAALCACTVICRGDLSDRLLSPKLHPEWQGERTSMVYRWPDLQKTLWKSYAEMRRTGQAEGDEGKAANEYYQQRRDEMDAGAEIAWPERFSPSELSSVQHCENLLIDLGEETFAAERQNQPLDRKVSAFQLTAETVASRCNGLPIRTAPPTAAYVTLFTDVNHYGLHWVLMAADQNLTGYVLDYGRYPAEGPVVPPDTAPSAAAKLVYAGLVELGKAFSKFSVSRSGGRDLPDLWLVDAGYMPDIVCQFARFARLPFRVLPSKGRGWRQYRPTKPIGVPHDNCHLSDWPGKGHVVEHNADYWRDATQRAFLQAPGAPGAISLYGAVPAAHARFARHVVAEYLIEHIRGDSTEFFNWGHVVGEIWDWLDCTVGCLVGACLLGGSFGGISRPAPRRQTARRRAKIARED